MSRGTQVPVGSRCRFRVRGYHPLWPALPDGSTSEAFCNSTMTGPTTPPIPKNRWFGLFRIRSPLLTESLLFSIPSGTKMVHFPEFASYSLYIQLQILRFCRSGFPHSEIPGSKPTSGSPRLIAACHVLHRLPSPRHPPYALSSLITTKDLPKILSFYSVESAGTTKPSTSALYKQPSLTACPTNPIHRICPSIFNCQRPKKPPTSATRR